jgi:hypothetical protein
MVSGAIETSSVSSLYSHQLAWASRRVQLTVFQGDALTVQLHPCRSHIVSALAGPITKRNTHKSTKKDHHNRTPILCTHLAPCHNRRTEEQHEGSSVAARDNTSATPDNMIQLASVRLLDDVSFTTQRALLSSASYWCWNCSGSWRLNLNDWRFWIGVVFAATILTTRRPCPLALVRGCLRRSGRDCEGSEFREGGADVCVVLCFHVYRLLL